MHNVSCFNESARDIRRAPPRERECIDWVNEGGEGKLLSVSAKEAHSICTPTKRSTELLSWLASVDPISRLVGHPMHVCSA